MDADVIVVGGGPAGSATAALLAGWGHDVLLLDRARFPRDKACAEYLSPATYDVLERLGALPRVLDAGAVRPFGMRVIASRHGQATIAYPDGGGRRRALCLTRRVLDATLLEMARQAGVQVREGEQVTGVEAEASVARVTVRRTETAPGTRQLSARARIRAVVVLPVPRGPLKR